jgi:hypothetical protein
MVLERVDFGLPKDLAGVRDAAFLVDQAPEVRDGAIVVLDSRRGLRQKHGRVVVVVARRSDAGQMDRNGVRT